MLTLETANEYLKSFGDGQARFDENGYCALQAGNDDGFAIHLRYLEDNGSVIAVAEAAPLPDGPAAGTLAAACLKMNFLWQHTNGFALALDGASSAVTLQGFFTSASVENFENFLLNFAESVVFVSDLLADPDLVSETDPDDEDLADGENGTGDEALTDSSSGSTATRPVGGMLNV
ncbi:MAG: type III secretion system chaperone [Succinivibrionaceae bacterium]|nr:type III secretion system chaperone [Succinivibrionaceae bacterium]